MKKITKKQYNDKKNALNARLEEVKAILAEAANTQGASLGENIDSWNDYHDAQDDIENELDRLEDEWSTRNWTASDWTSWELISQNID